jgi:hypothetical protein
MHCVLFSREFYFSWPVFLLLHTVYQYASIFILQEVRYWPNHEEGIAASESPLKHWAIFFLLPSKKFLPISFKIQLMETSPQKQKGQRQKQLDVSFFWCLFPSWARCLFFLMYFPFLYISVRCSLLLRFIFCQVYLPVKETAEIETGMAETLRWEIYF